MNKQTRIKLVKIIRRELQRHEPDMDFIKNLCVVTGLGDSHFWGKLNRIDPKNPLVQPALSDYLLDVKYWANREENPSNLTESQSKAK